MRNRPVPDTLYSRLALTLTVVLVLVGAVFGLATLYFNKQHVDLVVQTFNRDLAENLIQDRKLISEGQLNKGVLKKVFSEYMSINPNIEIYLLDDEGWIKSFSAPEDSVKLEKVSLDPLHTFLSNREYEPVVAEDPRNPGRNKAFSVAPVVTDAGMEGYLYVVLRGNDYDVVEQALEQRYFVRLGLQVLAMSLLVGLIAGLLVLRAVTRPISRITRSINQLRSDSEILPKAPPSGSRNELLYLEHSYLELTRRIKSQFESLEQVDRKRRDLVANISHDLRTPLASVVGYLEVLKTKSGGISAEQEQAYVDIAFRNAQRLSVLIDDLFELARLEASGTTLKEEPFSMQELADAVVCQQQPIAADKDIRLSGALGEGIPMVKGDINLLQRVLENLLSNAIQHNEAGSRIRLQLEKFRSKLRISVVDEGENIPDARFRLLTDRYTQGEERDESRPRAGLGLSIAKQILLLHGSDLGIDNSGRSGKSIYFEMDFINR